MAETKVYTRRIELFNRTRNLIGQTRRNIHKASFFHRVLLPGTFVGREGCRVSIRRAIHISPLPISLWRALTTTRTIVIIIFIAFLIFKKKKNHSSTTAGKQAPSFSQYCMGTRAYLPMLDVNSTAVVLNTSESPAPPLKGQITAV